MKVSTSKIGNHWVLKDISCLVTLKGDGKYKRKSQMSDIGILKDAYLEILGTEIVAMGKSEDCPANLPSLSARGKTVMPGFVDSHTHFVFTGYRDDEFEKRASGKSYMEIMKEGGGIHRSVQFLREASFDTLYAESLNRAEMFLKHGTTCVEVKSGYGLDRETELKCLRVIKKLNSAVNIELLPTFLGAHAFPRDFQGNKKDYLKFLIEEVIPEVCNEGLAEFCDIFCERDVFEIAESEYYLSKAKEAGLALRIHADELLPLGGTELGCRLGAASVDHLLHVSAAGIKALAESETLACLLPGTSFTLKEKFAPAREIIAAGAAVGLATDCNPGSSFTENMQVILSLACSRLDMSMAECLNAAIYNNAVSLGRIKALGSLEPGKKADFVVFQVPNYRHLFYHYGINHVEKVFKNGMQAWSI
ncbi:imidazolonepropionase [Candidatus Riflebacteria bacterium]